MQIRLLSDDPDQLPTVGDGVYCRVGFFSSTQQLPGGSRTSSCCDDAGVVHRNSTALIASNRDPGTGIISLLHNVKSSCVLAGVCFASKHFEGTLSQIQHMINSKSQPTTNLKPGALLICGPLLRYIRYQIE